MIKKFLKSLGITLSLTIFSSSAFAAPVKSVATVDMKMLFKEYHLTKKAQLKVKENQAKMADENKEKLAEMRKISDKMAELSKLISDGSIAPELKKKYRREREIQANIGNGLDTDRRDWLNSRNKAINEEILIEMKKILAEIKNKVDAFARSNDVDMVFDKSALGTTKTHSITVSKEEYDITSVILETLNKKEGNKEQEAPAGKP